MHQEVDDRPLSLEEKVGACDHIMTAVEAKTGRVPFWAVGRCFRRQTVSREVCESLTVKQRWSYPTHIV